jgi:hypothetical protein
MIASSNETFFLKLLEAVQHRFVGVNLTRTTRGGAWSFGRGRLGAEGGQPIPGIGRSLAGGFRLPLRRGGWLRARDLLCTCGLLLGQVQHGHERRGGAKEPLKVPRFVRRRCRDGTTAACPHLLSPRRTTWTRRVGPPLGLLGRLRE